MKEIFNKHRRRIKRYFNRGIFPLKRFLNLVEYDYFGWIHESPFVEDIIDIAKELQKDLRAYNFTTTLQEDLFGPNDGAINSHRSQRLLLGQEWTRFLASIKSG